MKARGVLIVWVCAALLLSGCWSKMELTERAFVLALAIDKSENGNLEMTSQIYKPLSQFGPPSGQGGDTSFINVTLDGKSVSNIIRNTKTVTGRHSQFSHIQILLISEDVARERLSDILDFFYRDPEIRLITSVMIARGKARNYLAGRSMIENTLGSQVFKQMNVSANLAGETVSSTLLDLAFGLKSESESAMMPVIEHDRKSRQNVVHGIALLKPDGMIGRIAQDKAPYLLLLADRYNYGFLELPCGGDQPLAETLEVLQTDTRISPVIEGDNVSARIEVKIVASIGELVCTRIQDMADEVRYAEKVEQYLKEQMDAVLETLQRQKADVLGIGHKLYSRHSARWKKLKPDWPERFARMPIETAVKVDILNSKMMNHGPFSRIGKE